MSEVLTLDERGMSETSNIIHGVIAGKQNLAQKLENQIDSLLANGAQQVLLGCTELSVINHSERFRRTIDPLNIIVERILK